MRTRTIKSSLELVTTSESATITCILAEKQKPAEKWESFYGEKKGGFHRCPDGKLLALELYWCILWHCLGGRCIFSSLWLVQSWKWVQKPGKLAIFHQVLAILSQWLQELMVGSLGVLLETDGSLASWLFITSKVLVSRAGSYKLWVRILAVYMVWTLSIYIFCLLWHRCYFIHSVLYNKPPVAGGNTQGI